MGHAILHLLDDMKPVPSPEKADVVVDFSHPDWTTPLVRKLLEDPRPLVVGTTGLGASLEEAVAQLAEQVPVVSAANTSTGVTVLRDL
ncbi:MAG: hypothetical protein VX498_07535, partial [Myxococcota bacterium]|nr:hypothetical protein [Myxococcota bacterium]